MDDLATLRNKVISKLEVRLGPEDYLVKGLKRPGTRTGALLNAILSLFIVPAEREKDNE